MKDVTRILSRIEQGDPSAAESLLPLIYQELRKLAAAKMAHESPDHTLQATALVHEAYLRLVDADQTQHWDSRGHFFAAAAEAMRRVLVDNVRRKQGPKGGGRMHRQDADPNRFLAPEQDVDALALDEALSRLSDQQPRVAKLVELRYFAGLSLKEAGVALGLSSRTADRYWAYAKAWLHRELGARGSD